MKNIIGLLAIVLLFSCSKEDSITTVNTVSGSLTVSDTENWIESEYLMLGLFKDDATSPDYSVQLSTPSNNQSIPFSISNVKSDNYTPKVYIAEERKANKAILHVFSIIETSEDVQLPSVSIQLLTYTRVQEQVFNNCLLCHGESTDVEAGLYLTNEKSYKALVNVPSEMEEGEILVTPNDVVASYLLSVLKNEHSGFDHSYSSTILANDIVLVEKWIENGALNNE